MKPVEFPEQNVIFAKDQPGYEPLPAMRNPEGDVVCCIELTDEEIETMKRNKCFWLGLKTFNRPLQPIMLSVNKSDFIKPITIIPDEQGTDQIPN